MQRSGDHVVNVAFCCAKTSNVSTAALGSAIVSYLGLVFSNSVVQKQLNRGLGWLFHCWYLKLAIDWNRQWLPFYFTEI